MLETGISIVVPVYNGSATLSQLVDRLNRVLLALVEEFEIILVDDASCDDSWQLINELARSHPVVRGIRLSRNFSQHNATLCGIRAARFDTTVTLDDDLQQSPEDIPRLLARLDEGFDIVYGKPRTDRHSYIHTLLSRFARRFVVFLTGANVLLECTQFRAFRTHLREAAAGFQGESVIVDTLLTWGTTKSASVLIDLQPRAAGRSGYRLLTRGHQVVTGLASFNTVPLQFAAAAGFASTVALIFVAVGLLLAIGWFGFNGVLGTLLALVLLVAAAAATSMLAIASVYIIRMVEVTSGRPPYVVSEVADAIDRDLVAGAKGSQGQPSSALKSE